MRGMAVAPSDFRIILNLRNWRFEPVEMWAKASISPGCRPKGPSLRYVWLQPGESAAGPRQRIVHISTGWRRHICWSRVPLGPPVSVPGLLQACAVRCGPGSPRTAGKSALDQSDQRRGRKIERHDLRCRVQRCPPVRR